MKLGAVFPTTEIGNDPAAIRDWVQTAESLGYDHIVAFDHVLGAAQEERELWGPYRENDAFHEPMTLFAYLAAVTERIELVTGVLVLPQRQTALVAKQAVQVDLLSGGRLRLGVGTGWNWVEYESLGMPYDKRGALLTEQVQVLRMLWEEELVDYTGEFHRIDRASILPRPERRIPLWFAALRPVALERAAQYGDGLIFSTKPSVVEKLLVEARNHVEAAGRSVDDFGTEAIVDYSYGPDAWRREFELWNACKGTHLTMRAMDTAATFSGGASVGYKGPQAFIDALVSFKEAMS